MDMFEEFIDYVLEDMSLKKACVVAVLGGTLALGFRHILY
jgi:hypothetical protein